MTSFSTSNQNTRVFAPYTILTQDTSRLAISIKTTDGLPTTGITAGDVIRWDVPTAGYTLSVASTEPKAEVLGVVESVNASGCTVVLTGSIQYPNSRLSAITSGGAGNVDVLFLSDTVSGGLTGTVDMSTSGEKIIKPVMQVAPHSIYNAVVTNYVGYKAGNQATISENVGGLPIGSVVYFPADYVNYTSFINSGGWTQLQTSNNYFSVSTYPDLYQVWVTAWTTAGYIERVIVSSGTVTSSFPRGTVTQSSVNVGTVYASGTSPSPYIDILKTRTQSLIDTTQSLIINGNVYSASSTSISEFEVPPVTDTNPPVQNSANFTPWIKTQQSSRVTIPDALSIASLSVSGNVAVGSITDLEAKITLLENRLNLLKNTTSPGLWP
jgi:hypothetical protein